MQAVRELYPFRRVNRRGGRKIPLARQDWRNAAVFPRFCGRAFQEN